LDIEHILNSKLSEGELEGAIELLKQERFSARFSPWIHSRLINIALERGEFLSAREYLEEIPLEAYKKHLHLHIFKFQLHQEMGWIDDPTVFFKSVIDLYVLDPNPDVWQVNFLLRSFLIADVDEEHFLGFLSLCRFSEENKSIAILFKKIIEDIKKAFKKNAYQSFVLACGQSKILNSEPNCLVVNFDGHHLIRGSLNNFEESQFHVCVESMCIFLNKLIFIQDCGWSTFQFSSEIGPILNLFIWAKTYEKCSLLLKNRRWHKFELASVDDPLLIRAGNVELWAIRDFLIDSKSFYECAIHAIEVANEAIIESVKPKVGYAWPKNNATDNWLRLITNAGFYADNPANTEAIDAFVSNYIAGLECGAIYPTYLLDLYILARIGLKVERDQLRDWDDARFIEDLSCRKNLLFVSSFGNILNKRWRNGDISNFWNAMSWPMSNIENLYCIESPSSIWPYHPHSSWLETFTMLKSEIDSIVEESSIDCFIASCGSYSIPLAKYVFKRFGIKSITMGHYPNLFFGIYSRAFQNHPFLATVPLDSPLWFHSDLASRYPASASLDDGKYI